MMKEQIETARCSHAKVMRHPNFARGLEDIREGRPFNYEIQDNYWAYERGRQFGARVPPSLPLFIGKKLNPVAVKVFSLAYDRKEIR